MDNNIVDERKLRIYKYLLENNKTTLEKIPEDYRKELI